MVPAIYNLPTGYRGDSYGPVIFKFLDGSGNAVILSGVTGALHVKEAAGLSTVLSWTTTDNSMFIGGVSGNEIRLNPKPGNCMLIGPDTFVYDLQLSSGDMTRTYVKGNFPIEGDITYI